MTAQPIKSPCILVCRLNADGRYCVGCARSTAEIGRWSAMSEAERDATMAALPARRARLGLPPAAN